MKISIEITSEGIKALHIVLQDVDTLQATTRASRATKSILEEVYSKVYRLRCNFTGNKAKNVSFKFYQASILELFLRGLIEGNVPLGGGRAYHEIRKIADELHQQVS